MNKKKKKGPFVEKKLIILSNNEIKISVRNYIQTDSRSSTIIPSFVGKIFLIHNGKNYYKLKILDEMIGHKLGEFVPTRKTFTFKKQKKK